LCSARKDDKNECSFEMIIASMEPRCVQRGRHCRYAKAAQGDCGFNGAALCSARKEPSSSCFQRELRSFNGAALCSARKGLIALATDTRKRTASMEPRCVQRGRCEEVEAEEVQKPTLQWSRAVFSAEGYGVTLR